MRADIVALARGWLGTPYHHQASLKGVGCDCLGLVRGVYAEACGQPAETPPPYSRDWAEAASRETMIEGAARHLIAVDPRQAEPGDVLIFRLRPGAMAKHCGIVSCAPGIRPAAGPLAGPEASAPGAPRGIVSCAPAEHCGIVTGHPGPASGPEAGRMAGFPTKIIHAVEGAPVCEVHITPWWRQRIAAAFRFPDQGHPYVQPVQQP